MFATTRRFWNRLTRRRRIPSLKRPRIARLPLRIEGLEVRDVPATLFAVTEAPNQQLLMFNSATPGAAVSVPITGLGAGESLVGIDFRPLNEQLYGISNFGSKLYQINQSTGVVTFVGSFGAAPVATSFGMDFNPVVDKIRYTSDVGNNLRINPDTGALVSSDPGINGATTGLDAVAYTNNFFGATTTQLFGINSATDTVYLVTDPNAGTTTSVGLLNADTDNRVAFDVADDDGVAYAMLTVGGVSKLYTVDLGTGNATEIGKIGTGAPLVGLSAQPAANADPVVTFSGVTQTYDVQTDVPVQIDPGATIRDPDSPFFGGGKLTVMSAASVAGDLVSIGNFGMVTISGSDVLFNGVKVGTFTSGDGFTTPLSVDFNASASLVAVEGVLRAVTFSTTDNSLMPNTRSFSATVTDGAGGTGTTPTMQTVMLADTTGPSALSINRDLPNPTNATSVTYTVTFNEDVTGVDITDFKLATTGLTGSAITLVTPITASSYTVTVDVGTGNIGTLGLDLINDGTIADLTGNKLTAGFMGQVYDIDRVGPEVFIAVTAAQPNPAFSQPVTFFVSFTEVVTGFDVSDLDFSMSTVTGTLTANIVPNANGMDFDVVVMGATSDGDIVLNIPAGAAMDMIGNPSKAGDTTFGNTITLDIVNNAPVITAPATVTTPEDTEFAFTGADTVSVADADLNNGEIQIKLTATNGTVRLGSTTNLTFSVGDGTAATTMTFKGLLADVNNALATLFFNPTANFSGAATVVVDADDLGNSGTGGPLTDSATINVTVSDQNDAPTITFANTPYSTNEDTVFNFGTGSIVIADDSGPNDIQVTLTSANGKLTFGSITGLTFTAGDGTDDATMTFKGTLAAINAALDTLSFNPTLNFNGNGTLKVDVDDLGSTGTGGNKTATGSETITVNAVNDGPTITAPATVTTPEDTQLVFSGANLISIADVDAGTGSLQVTLAVLHGTISLSGTAGLTFTTGDGTNDASMTFKGTLSSINSALSGMKYNPTAAFNGADTLSINVDDQGNTGSGGAKTASQNVGITVTAVADIPTAVNDSFTTKQNTPLVVNAPGILANDTDPDGGQLSAILVTNVPAGTGTLTFTGGNGTGNGGFTFVPASNFVGTVSFTYRASNGPNQSNIATVTITVTENFTRLFATGAGEGGGPQVIVHNEDGSIRFSFYAFDPSFSGGVSVATGDVNGDGIEDIIVGAGPGGGPHVRVLSGADLGQIHSFYAYDPSFAGGVNVAAGDVNGDGFADIITGAGAGGGPHVRVIDGRTGGQIHSFYAYDPLFTGGVNVASADYNSDGKSDIVTGAGPGGTPHVIVYSGTDAAILQSFFAFDPNFAGGVRVAAGEFNDEPSIFTAAGSGGVPVVSIYDFKTATEQASFFAFDEATHTSGVHIATEVDFDGTTTILLGGGANFAPDFRALDANTLAEVDSFSAYDPAFLGGVFVG